MNAKRDVGARVLAKLSKHLELGVTSTEKSTFPRAASRNDASLKLLSEDQYELVKDWYHYALHDLLSTRNCQRHAAALAKR